jgi:hypothetical protein
MARMDGEREDQFFCKCQHIVQLIIYIICLAPAASRVCAGGPPDIPWWPR